MRGYVKINRSIVEDEMYFSEKFTRTQAWIDLILIANFNPSCIYVRGVKIPIARGMLAYSLDTLAVRWKWSRGKVIRFLLDLERQKKIIQQKNHIITRISIINYSKYQDNDTTDETANDTADDTANDTADDTHNKNDNNVNNVNNNNTSKPSKEIPAICRKVVELYSGICVSYPKLITISKGRAVKIKERFAEMKNLMTVESVFRKMEESDFLKGKNNNNWKATFDWVMANSINWCKVLEGNYDNKTSQDLEKNFNNLWNK